MYDTESWPFDSLICIKEFIYGHSSEDLSLKEKFENDFNMKPSRHIRSSGRKLSKSSDRVEVTGLPLNERRLAPTIYLASHAPEGYRVIFGTFDFDETLHGAILLNSEGESEHFWKITQESLPWFSHSDTNVFPHGFEIDSDGSIVTAYDAGSSLTKYDYCGNIIWQIAGSFHHSIDFEDEASIWVWEHVKIDQDWVQYLVKVDYTTGERIKSIPLPDIVEKNHDIDIFGIRQIDTGKGSTWVDDGGGRWHPNDISPLPKEYARFYKDFKPGDLLISLRNPNLIFVIDPDSLKVKWWRQGLVRRQHDPDWNDRGTITIFNNNMHREYSNIVEIDPATYKHRVALDGKPYDFYTWWRGKHQPLPGGGLLVISSDQGRVFETDAEGNVTFEFINRYAENNQTLAISEARFLAPDFFKELPQCL